MCCKSSGGTIEPSEQVQSVGQNCHGRPRSVWNDVVLSDIHKSKLYRYTRDALNKPVWRELTYVACTMLAKYTF